MSDRSCDPLTASHLWMISLVLDCYIIQTLCNARLLHAIRVQAFSEASEASVNWAEVHLSSFILHVTGGNEFHPFVMFSFWLPLEEKEPSASLLRCRFIYFFLKLDYLIWIMLILIVLY